MDPRMRPRRLGVLLTALCVLGSAGCVEGLLSPRHAEPKPGPVLPPTFNTLPAGRLWVAGPFCHDNLAVFLVHGKDTVSDEFVTLDEALARKLIVVHETGNVGALTVDNLSDKETLFLQAGEMVSGGRQDRLLGTDLVLPPNARNVPIPSFCVESDRWTRRGSEEVGNLVTNANYIPSAELKIASRVKKDQGEVWNYVRRVQEAEIGNVPGMNLNSLSPSSLDLTLEDPKLKEAVAKYTDALAGIVRGKPDVIGFAFAVNGELNSADVYGTRALFAKLWPKLLEAAANEAIAKLQKGKEFAPPPVESAAAWLSDEPLARMGEFGKEEKVTERIAVRSHVTESEAIFGTFDAQTRAAIHTSHVKKPSANWGAIVRTPGGRFVRVGRPAPGVPQIHFAARAVAADPGYLEAFTAALKFRKLGPAPERRSRSASCAALSAEQVSALLRAVSRERKGSVLTAPRLTVFSGQRGSLRLGQVLLELQPTVRPDGAIAINLALSRLTDDGGSEVFRDVFNLPSGGALLITDALAPVERSGGQAAMPVAILLTAEIVHDIFEE